METTAQAIVHLKEAFALYQETDDFEKALAACDVAIALDPDLADAHNLRGVLLEELGRPSAAMNAYGTALRIDPDYTEAADNLAELRAELAISRHLVTIATFLYPTEAYIPKGILESEGIWSSVADVYTITANWLYSTAIGGVKLQVRQEDAQRAVEILNSRADGPIEEEEVQEQQDHAERCPVCGSGNVRYLKYATPLVFLSWLVLDFPLPFMRRRWKCGACSHVWKKREDT
jgi:tetratricopeptide (TPR) repeat protein